MKINRTFGRVGRAEEGRVMSGRRNVRGEDGVERIKGKTNRVGEMRTFEQIKESGRIRKWGEPYQAEEGMFGEEWSGHTGGRMAWGILRVGEHLDGSGGNGEKVVGESHIGQKECSGRGWREAY